MKTIQEKYCNFMGSLLLRYIEEPKHLSIRESEILSLFFRENLSFGEISKKIYISKERVRQIIIKSLHRIAHQIFIRLKSENPTIYESKINNLENKIKLLEKIISENIREQTIDIHDNRINVRICDLDLSIRAKNCLRCENIETIGELILHSKYELLKIRNMGGHTATEIEDFLIKKYKLNLKQ
jgi:predicted DNA-binding protein (UPF0251 family)